MINLEKLSYSFLTVGKTQESTETQEFKRYIGIGSSYVMAVNPSKEELEKIYGTPQEKAPEYVVDTERGKEVRIHFIVKTDPEQCGGVEIINRLMFTLRNTAAYNRDESKVQVIDKYGESTWANTEDVNQGKKLLSSEGKELRIDTKYRKACSGEAELVNFLKIYLGIPSAFEYKNGTWVKKATADKDSIFSLDNIKDYFNGNFSELKEALKLQPNNKVKLLYGIRTADTDSGKRQYQAIATRINLILPNNAGVNAVARLEKELSNYKASGGYPNTEFEVCELKEWSLEPTNLEKKKDDDPFGGSNEMPWD